MMTELFQSGHFKLSSGIDTQWKIECDALSAEDWETLAFIAFERHPWIVNHYPVAIPRGGLPFKKALEEYCRGPMALIVDDVYTTGGSIRMEREWIRYADAPALVAFARGRIYTHNTYAIWSLYP